MRLDVNAILTEEFKFIITTHQSVRVIKGLNEGAQVSLN